MTRAWLGRSDLNPSSLFQRILVELAGLHDHRQMGALIEEQLELLQRIAVDEDEIGEGARLHDAELALLAQNLDAHEGRLRDDLQRLQDSRAIDEFLALLDLER